MSDEIFWERLAEMPLAEAEQELVLRRERIVQRLGEVIINRKWADESGRPDLVRKTMAEQLKLQGQITLINERIKYIRKVVNESSMKDAVANLFGPGAVADCLIWIEKQRIPTVVERKKWLEAA